MAMKKRTKKQKEFVQSQKDLKNLLKTIKERAKIYPYITYKKDGRIVRHKKLSSAIVSAKSKAFLGRRAFVDKDLGTHVKNIKTFEPRRKIRRR